MNHFAFLLSVITLANLGLVIVSSGCNQPPGVNPWVDDSISSAIWSTPSRDGVLDAGREPTIRLRDMPETQGPYVSRDVPHYPLWWEDPFEDKGDLDAAFAWTWQDYLAIPYSFGRKLLNTAAWPISAVVTPPGTPMVSDGHRPTHRDHDAIRGISPNPAAAPSDFGYTQQTEP